MSDHPSTDDLYAYALGSLEAGEEKAIARHVPYCDRCSTELRERIYPAVGVLAESVEQHQPPPELRERVMAVVRGEAAEEPAERSVRQRRRLDLRGFILRPAVALSVAAVLVAGLGGYLVASGGEGSETVRFESAMASAAATLEVADDGSTLEARGMPALSKGAVYQVWVQEGSVVKPSAAFVPHEDGTATAAVPEELGAGSKVLVTREPMAGRRTPTPPPILSAGIN